MKTPFLFTIFMILASLIHAQSYLATLDKTKMHETVSVYDGQSNYLKKKVYLYIGQTMQFKCDSRHEMNDSSFVLGFTVDYKINRDKYGNIYPRAYHPSKKGIGTDYHKIVNNNFEVLDVVIHPWANHENEKNKYNHVYYLKLHNLTLNDTAYYEYFAVDKDRYFPFIVTKHQQFVRKRYVGKFFQMEGYLDENIKVNDYQLNKPIFVAGKTWWKCVDLITNDQNCEFSLILEKDNQKIVIPLTQVDYLLKNNTLLN